MKLQKRASYFTAIIVVDYASVLSKALLNTEGVSYLMLHKDSNFITVTVTGKLSLTCMFPQLTY